MEIELKFLVQGSVSEREVLFTRLSNTNRVSQFRLEPARFKFTRDVYYDRPDGSLLAAGYRLRLRDDGVLTATLKATGTGPDQHRRERQEWEGELTPSFLSELFRRLAEDGIPVSGQDALNIAEFAAGEACHGFVPALLIRTDRLVRTVLAPDNTPVASLCVDRVMYPGRSRDTFYEIEIEQLPGGDRWLESIGQALIEAGGSLVTATSQSKVKRGLALVKEENA